MSGRGSSICIELILLPVSADPYLEVLYPPLKYLIPSGLGSFILGKHGYPKLSRMFPKLLSPLNT